MKSTDNIPVKKPYIQIYARFGLWIVLIISFVWTVSLVLAPLTIPPNTVVALNGGANRIDFWDLWAEMPPYQAFIYLLGDIQCHQKSSRTIFINNNEMPVCARDASIFFFLTVGLVLSSIMRPDVSVSRALIRMLPAKLRSKVEKGNKPMIFSWLLGFICITPLAIDASIQLFTSYESTNVTRFLTGIPIGIFGGLVFGLLIQSIYLLPSPHKRTHVKERQIEKKDI